MSVDNAVVTSELETELRSATGDDSLRIVGDLQRLTGGFDTDTYAFKLETSANDSPDDLVLRHYREATGSDRPLIESTVQNLAARAGHPVPEVPFDTIGRSLLGRAYMVMRRMPGSSLLETLMSDPVGNVGTAAEILGATQAKLHGLASGGMLQALAQSRIDSRQFTPFRLHDDLSRLSELTGDRTISSLARWLKDHRPADSEHSYLCHGDFHPGNVLVSDGQVTGVIDWGNFVIGPAEYDVAVTRFLVSIGPVEETGIPREQIETLLQRFISVYDKTYGGIREIDESLTDYFTVLRVSHAMAKVLAGKDGADIPGIAHEGYAWSHPVVYELMRRRLLEITDIDCGPLKA